MAVHHRTKSARAGTASRVRASTAEERAQVLADLPLPRVAEPDDGPDDSGRRWAAHPWAARVVQLVVLAVPIAASVATGLVISAALPRSSDLGIALLWWAVVVVSSTVVMFAVDRIARRGLPLAVLLRLSLVFPDQAPRRYRLAAQAWSSRRLRERVERARLTGETSAPIEAAAQIIGLLASLSIHDRRTRGHCERVRAYNDLLAEELGLPQSDRDRLRWAALIHDIGKLRVSPRLLNKPAAPTADEWSVLRAHPLRGMEIAAPLAGWLGPWAAAIEEHHEHWDGTGYPHGRQGTDISLGARIVAVADAFEVMTSTRPYSRPVDAAAARTELAECAGMQFDPMVVRAFLNISLGRLRKIMGPIAWLAQVPFVAGLPRLEAAIIGGGRQAAAGAGAAGAAAGVVAVTSLTPAGAHHHAHTPPPTVLSETAQVAPAGPGDDGFPVGVTGVPMPPTDVRTNAAPEPRQAHKHSAGATSQHDARPAARPETTAAQDNGNGPGRNHGTGPASATHAHVTPVRASGAPDDHGRCAGNHGRGFGNGGPQNPDDLRTLPDPARLAHEHAPGLRVCD